MAAAAARVEHFQKMEMTEKTWSTWCCVAQFPVHKMGEYADNKYCNGLLTDCHWGWCPGDQGNRKYEQVKGNGGGGAVDMVWIELRCHCKTGVSHSSRGGVCCAKNGKLQLKSN